MKIHLTMLAKSLALVVATIAVLTLSQGVARADEITLSGFTTGTVSGVPQLTFEGNTFTGRTFAGVGALSGNNYLGRLSLSRSSTGIVPIGGMFTLGITFTQPTGIDGGASENFFAEVVGSISSLPDEGGLHIHFLQPSQTFTFNDGTNFGTFSLVIADVFVQTEESTRLTAGFFGSQNATPSQVPEPATLLLLGTGLAGIAAKLRQRKKAREI